MHSAGVKFRIRSSSERQNELSQGRHLETKVSRNLNERKEEVTNVHPYSSSSPDSRGINKMPIELYQVGFKKEPDLHVGNKMSHSARGKPDLGDLITQARGRTEARQAMSNRSKSLDWRGVKAERRKGTPTVVTTESVDVEGSIKRQAERMGTANRANTVKLATQANRTSLQFSVKKDTELPYSSDLSSDPQGDPASIRSPTNMLGARERRQAMSSRSASLDWSGTRREDGKESETLGPIEPESSQGKDMPIVDKTSSLNKEPLQLSISKDAGLSIDTETSSITQGTADSVRNPVTNARGRTEWRQAMSNRSKSLDWRGKRGEGRNEPKALAFWDTIDVKGRYNKPYESSERKANPDKPNSNELPRSLDRASLQPGVSREAELPFSSATRGNSEDSVRSPAANVRGRTEWRQVMSNRSKSLDWRGKRGEGRNESQASAVRDPLDLEGSTIRLPESSARKETPNRPNSNEPSGSSNRALLQFSASKDAGVPFGTEMVDGTQGKPSVKTSTTKAMGKSEWRQFMTNSKSLDLGGRKTTRIANLKDLTDNKGSSTRNPGSSEVTGMANANEPTSLPNGKMFSSASLSAKMARLPLAVDHTSGSQSLPYRLKQKDNGNSTQDAKSTWRHSGQGVPKPDESERRVASQTYGTNVKEISGDLTKPGRTEQNDGSSASVESFASGIGSRSGSNALNSNSNRKASVHDSWVGRTPPSLGNMKHVPYNSEKGGTFPRISSKGLFQRPIPDALPSGAEKVLTRSTERTPREESSYQRDRNSKHFERAQAGASDGLGTHSLDRVRNRNFRPALSRAVTIESSHSAFNSSSNSVKTTEGLAETPSESVRNKIHRFEALVKQNQSPSYMLHSRRTFSLQERSDDVVEANKQSSEKFSSLRRGDWYTGYLKEHLFSKSDEMVSSPDLSGLVSVESGAAQPLKCPEGPRIDPTYKPIKHGTKLTTVNQPMDEPDSFLISRPKLQNTESAERSDRIADASQSNPKDISNSRSDSKTIFHENRISTSNHKAFQNSKSNPVLPDSTAATSKSPLGLSSDSSASGNQKVLSNTVSDKRAAAKVSKWIMGNRDGIYNEVENDDDDDDDDDEDDESTEKGDDSDSGDSSVTITSNMSRTDHPGFSVSLVDLCSLGGLDYPPPDGSRSNDEEHWMSTRTSSMSSDVSALSSVTLLGSEELDRLLDDVRGLGEEALQNSEDIHVVVLHKEVGNGVGFTVAGGVDQNKPVTVHRVITGGLAAQEGSIHKGDYVLSINGTALHSSTHREALHTLRKAKKRGMAVVVVRRGDIAEAYNGSKDGPRIEPRKAGRKICVTLTKSSHDLGFSLEGGIGSSLGDKPLTVHRLFQGGPVGKVFPGDELLEVEGQSLEGLRRLEAWNLIKRLPYGPVDVILQRYHLPH